MNHAPKRFDFSIPVRINLYSDTQSKPTPGMKEAMLNAEVGDEQGGSDPTVWQLCDRVAALLGKEAAMFLPSGRVHAIGGGLVIYEIQQNSDTTYRVFDWNRVGLDGKPRPLHQRESVMSIDFEDFEPSLLPAGFAAETCGKRRVLAANALFNVEEWVMEAGTSRREPPGVMQVIGVVTGNIQVHNGTETVSLSPGGFCVVPASVDDAQINAGQTSRFLAIAAE